MSSALPSSSSAPDVLLSLRKGSQGAVGEARIRLLGAVREHGSISAAARAAGVTYKTAWDGIDALNNLFDRPLVIAKPGGRHGGGATVTPEGEAVITAYQRLQGALTRAVTVLEQSLDGDTDPSLATTLLGMLSMRTTARNALRGTITEVRSGAVNDEVILTLSGGETLTAIVTHDAVTDLALAPGREAVALIKSTFVILAPDQPDLRTSARNRLTGTITRLESGAVSSEAVLDIGGGKTLTAVITNDSMKELDLAVGMRVSALVKASHIILAVD